MLCTKYAGLSVFGGSQRGVEGAADSLFFRASSTKRMAVLWNRACESSNDDPRSLARARKAQRAVLPILSVKEPDGHLSGVGGIGGGVIFRKSFIG